MAKKQGKQNQRRLVVSLRHAATPDDSARLSRAIGILLKAAAEANSPSRDTSNGKKESPQRQGPTKDALTRGSSGNDSRGEG